MKAIHNLITMAAAVLTATSSLLVLSCGEFSEPDTGIPVKLSVTLPTDADVPSDILSSSSPCHVMAYAREKDCKNFYYLWEANATMTSDGQLKWSGGIRYWPGEKVKFVAYWPADATMTIDSEGNVLSGDCQFIAETEPANQFSGTVTLAFRPM